MAKALSRKGLCRNAYARLRQRAESVFLVQHIRHFAGHTNDDN
ncbi:MAG: hypothetical protein ACREXY_06710 [Gammaproteobacteria bacterium]